MKFYYIKNKWLQRNIERFQKGVTFLSLLFSLVVVAMLVVRFGFELDAHTATRFGTLYFYSAVVFLFQSVINLILDFKKYGWRERSIALGFSAAYFLVVWVHLFGKSFFGVAVEGVFQNIYFLMTLLGLSAVFNLARFTLGILARKTNPSLILSSSFLVIIFLGAALLCLPRATYHGISFVDSLFISTSAVCVTGLTSVDVASVFTPVGLVVILLLIQIGGLGVMTITSLFGFFFMGQTSLYNKFVVKDILKSDSIGSLLRMLVYVFVFTILFELAGALLIWLSVRGTLGMELEEEIYFSLFHSISAFCNAGFSYLPGNLGNSSVIGNNMFLYIISFLIIFGGIGFPILTNMTSTAFYEVNRWIKKAIRYNSIPPRKVHIVSINTKIVLKITFFLLLFGTILIGFFEWNHSFEPFTTSQKIAQSFFNAVTPRTAGFSTVSFSSMSVSSLLVVMALMWIGGGAQSTAGGVKVNAVGVAIYSLINAIKGRTRVEIMGREISPDSVSRVLATLFLSLVTLVVAIVLLTVFEPYVRLERLIFEAVSALGTVGLSMDLSQELSTPSKIIDILLMFVGRVGLLTFVMGLVRQAKTDRYRYPSEEVIIN